MSSQWVVHMHFRIGKLVCCKHLEQHEACCVRFATGCSMDQLVSESYGCICIEFQLRWTHTRTALLSLLSPPIVGHAVISTCAGVGVVSAYSMVIRHDC